MLFKIIQNIVGWRRSPVSKTSSTRSMLFQPILRRLEDRCTPAKFLWDPATGEGANNNWSNPRNWDIWTGTTYNWQWTFTPGVGDTAVYDGTEDNSDCIQDVMNGVTVDNVQVIGGFSKSIILSNPLTISGTSTPSTLSLSSGAAALRGSAVGQPAFRGTLNLAGNSVFAWNAGIINNLTVNVTRTATTVATLAVSNSTYGPHEMSGSDINVDGVLHWYSGDVSVTNSTANSNIYINSGGDFEIEAAGATWGTGIVGSTYFKINNNNLVRLNAQGAARFVGDYITYGVTRLDLGILVLAGKAEQYNGGEFEIRGCSVETIY